MVCTPGVAREHALCCKLRNMHTANPLSHIARTCKRCLTVLLLVAPCAAPGHEFWLHAAPFSPSTGGSSDISLHLGEFYVGELVGVTAAHAASIKLVNAAGIQDLTAQAPTGSMLRSLRLTTPRPGAQVLAYDSHPSVVTLSTDKFHAYLNEEGLGAVIRQREAAQMATTEGRERFRRHAKAILKVGGRSDATAMAATGQKLEIVPLVDPLQASAGGMISFEVRWESRALAGVLVKAWHRRGDQTVVVRTVTDPQGRVRLELPFAGAWMLSAVHMVPVTGVPDIDWDSHWSSLSFELGGRQR